jgi:hypothetical protein
MNDNLKIKADSGKWLVPDAFNPHSDVKDVGVGDLVITAGRLSIILKINTHTANFKKMVKLRLIGENEDYWINFNTFTELYGGKANG